MKYKIYIKKFTNLIFSAEEQINELQNSSISHSKRGRQKYVLNLKNVNIEDIFWKFSPFKEIQRSNEVKEINHKGGKAIAEENLNIFT